jgi:hypothetical protein
MWILIEMMIPFHSPSPLVFLLLPSHASIIFCSFVKSFWFPTSFNWTIKANATKRNATPSQCAIQLKLTSTPSDGKLSLPCRNVRLWRWNDDMILCMRISSCWLESPPLLVSPYPQTQSISTFLLLRYLTLFPYAYITS